MYNNESLFSLRKSGLTQTDYQLLIEIMYACSHSNSLQTLSSVMSKLHLLIPFDYMVSAMIRTNPQGVVRAYEITNVSYPDEWLQCYKESGFELLDPVVIHHCKTFDLTHWDHIPGHMAKGNKFWKSAHDFNLTNGMVYGLRNHTFPGGSLFSFSGQELTHWRHELILKLVVPHFDIKMREFTSIQNSSITNLTPREIEVLRWIKEGKSNWEISTILNIHERTVKFHISSIFDKLNVVKRSQAVAVALSNGILDI